MCLLATRMCSSSCARFNPANWASTMAMPAFKVEQERNLELDIYSSSSNPLWTRKIKCLPQTAHSLCSQTCIIHKNKTTQNPQNRSKLENLYIITIGPPKLIYIFPWKPMSLMVWGQILKFHKFSIFQFAPVCGFLRPFAGFLRPFCGRFAAYLSSNFHIFVPNYLLICPKKDWQWPYHT